MSHQHRDDTLCELLASLQTPEEVRALLLDACTLRELDQLAQRIECAGYLLRGDTYQKIIAETDISSTTLSRVSRCIQQGSGGYAELLRDFLVKRGELHDYSRKEETK